MAKATPKTAADIRRAFLDYFAEQQHQVVASSSLVPNNDPTLLFTNAGMVQFKDYLLNPSSAPMPRATTVQRCLRVGGKHNDLENVGYTARHHTFFEMLGNFSFGDYFKKEAIEFAWNFLTKIIQLPANKLYATVYQDDDDAYQLWHDEMGLPKERLVRLGEKDNFWSMGDTGPCGPCSEILYDQGVEVGCQKADCRVGCDCDRYLEIWNLVFMQFNRDADGKLTPLPKPCIDTGMGLERIVAVVQGVQNNYHTDCFRNLILRTSLLLNTPYDAKNVERAASFHVIADHVRAATFMIADGIIPGNEGRGYVLRRILRRAMRHGRNLGAKQSFLFEVADAVIHDMQTAYPYLSAEKSRVQKLIQEEEMQFLETLERGMKYLVEEMATVKSQKLPQFPGATAFYLYETYGFPVDLTEDILRGEKLPLDRAGFEVAEQQHRQKAKGSWKQESGQQDNLTLAEVQLSQMKVAETQFVGYEQLNAKSPLLWMMDHQGKTVTTTTTPGRYLLAFAQTPFYAESGGQVGDRGWLRGDDLQAEVHNTQKRHGIFLHQVELIRGQLQTGDNYTLQVDADRRAGISRNHSLTHLLHASLYELLGDHVRQAGSYLDEQRLSFDFSHNTALTPLQLQALERSIHEKIWGNYHLRLEELPYADAVKRGAKAFFAEKYGSVVRVVSFGDFSIELCGGTHVSQTGVIGMCRITGEHSVAAKTRRIELISGAFALDRAQQEYLQLKQLGQQLKTSPDKIEARIEQLLQEQKQMQKQQERLHQSALAERLDKIVAQATQHGTYKIILANLENIPAVQLRQAVDQLTDKLGQAVVGLAGHDGGKAHLVVKVSKELTTQLPAQRLIQAAAKIMGGAGGGRAEMAQAGGGAIEKIAVALEQLQKLCLQPEKLN